MAKNYYDILGISKSASKDDVKKAFRKLAHKYHPDTKSGDEKKFKEINEAYSVLSDDKKRAEYDAYGQVFSGGTAGGYRGAEGGFESPFGDFDFSQFAQGGNFTDFDLGDIFGEFFGSAAGGGGRARRGRDISIDIELSFSEAVFGAERRVLISKNSICVACKGTGSKPGSFMQTCPTCNGKGKMHESRRSFFGSFNAVKTCSDCRGRGEIPREKCAMCRGEGITRRSEEVAIRIPFGINDGEMIRMNGMGEAVSGGAPGDLYVKIHVKNHPVFRREGENLVMDLNIKLSSALLGEEYKIETLDGPISVKIPAGMSHGEILRVRGKGIPIDRSRRGDLLIKISVKIPGKLSKEAREMIEKLRKEGI